MLALLIPAAYPVSLLNASHVSPPSPYFQVVWNLDRKAHRQYRVWDVRVDSIKHVLSCPPVDKWRMAIQSELDALAKRRVVGLTDPTPSTKLLPSRMLFAIKHSQSSM